MDWKCFLCIVIHLLLTGQALDIKSCDRALGMESEEIPDSAVTASSSYVPNVGPKNGRLKLERAGGAWCPKPQVESGVREYLQIDLKEVHVVTGIQTQGRYDHGRGQEYVEEYMVEYWRDSLNQWKQYTRWDGKQLVQMISALNPTCNRWLRRTSPMAEALYVADRMITLKFYVDKFVKLGRLRGAGRILQIDDNDPVKHNDDSNTNKL